MKKKSQEPKVNLLPSYLLNDIEYDEYDKELHLKSLLTNEDSSINSKTYNNLFSAINNLIEKEKNDALNPEFNNILLNKNDYISLVGEKESNLLSKENKNVNIILNPINSDVKNFAENTYKNNYLDYIEHLNDNFNTNGIVSNSFSDEKECSNTIINLLKINPNIYSYINIIDYLKLEEMLNMFSFILKNIMIFVSNSQSFLIIDKIISLYNSTSLNSKLLKDTNIENINESIFLFLFKFFSKRIIYLINSSNYIASILNLVVKLGYPKNNFIFSEIKEEFKNYALNRPGCILIQNIFHLGTEKQQQNLLREIFYFYDELINDKYGHYIFKYLLYKAANGEKYFNMIFSKIIITLKKYVNNKYSSVVVERLLDSSNDEIKDKIVCKLCKSENDIIELIYHPYGNYVLQKIIKVTKNYKVLSLIYNTVMNNKNSLYKLSYGKKIMKEINVAYTLK